MFILASRYGIAKELNVGVRLFYCELQSKNIVFYYLSREHLSIFVAGSLFRIKRLIDLLCQL